MLRFIRIKRHRQLCLKVSKRHSIFLYVIFGIAQCGKTEPVTKEPNVRQLILRHADDGEKVVIVPTSHIGGQVRNHLALGPSRSIPTMRQVS